MDASSPGVVEDLCALDREIATHAEVPELLDPAAHRHVETRQVAAGRAPELPLEPATIHPVDHNDERRECRRERTPGG